MIQINNDSTDMKDLRVGDEEVKLAYLDDECIYAKPYKVTWVFESPGARSTEGNPSGLTKVLVRHSSYEPKAALGRRPPGTNPETHGSYIAFYGDIVSASYDGSISSPYYLDSLTIYPYPDKVESDITALIRTKVRQYSLSRSLGSYGYINVTRTSVPYSSWGATGSMQFNSDNRTNGNLYYGDKLSYSYGTNSAAYEITSAGLSGYDSSTGVTQNITAYAYTRVKEFTLDMRPNSSNSNISMTAYRTSSPYKGASTGYLSNGTTIYYGDVIRISASAATGYHLTTDPSYTYTINNQATFIATAEKNTYSLYLDTDEVGVDYTSVSVRTSSKGTINRSSLTYDDNGYYKMAYNNIPYGDTVYISASASSGYALNSYTTQYTCTGDKSISITAYATTNTLTITYYTDSSIYGKMSGAASDTFYGSGTRQYSITPGSTIHFFSDGYGNSYTSYVTINNSEDYSYTMPHYDTSIRVFFSYQDDY